MKYAMVLLLLGVFACAQLPAAQPSSLSVIVGFRSEAPARDRDRLAAIAKASNVELSFRAAISPRSAAYTLQCPSYDAGCRASVVRLAAHPDIEYVEVDRREKTQ